MTDRSRRDVLQGAVVIALAAASPASILALAREPREASKRYVLLGLTDGRILAIDRLEGLRVSVLTRRPLRDGRYRLSRSGGIAVENGRLTGVEGEARSTGYRLVQDRGGAIEVREWGGAVVLRLPPPSRGR